MKFNLCLLGKVSYGKAFKLQQKLLELCAQRALEPTFLVLEHDPVITIGNLGSTDSLFYSKEQLKEDGIEIFFSDRGGDVTCHMPGQLVIYPIFPLKRLKLGVRDYVCLLEKSIIALLAKEEIIARTISGQPGVWVEEKKIASIGIRVKQQVTMHGLALNVKNDLSLFQKVVPCGIRGCQMTSLAEQIQKRYSVGKLGESLVEIMAQSLGAQVYKQSLASLISVSTPSSNKGHIYGSFKRNPGNEQHCF